MFLILALLGFSFVLAIYWSFTQQGVAQMLIAWQVSLFGGYYVIATFLLTWLAVLVPLLPVAFVLGKLCDRLGW